MADAVPSATPGSSEETPRKRSLFARIRLAAFATLVIAAECAVAYFYLPLDAAPAAQAEAAPQAEASPFPFHAEAEGTAEHPEEVERELGEYSVTSFQPATNTTLRIDFDLCGTIEVKDAAEFDLAMEESKNRIRDQVITTVRSCDMGDLTDAGLALIKRKILEKTNATLGKPYLKAVIFSDFSFIEQ